MHIHFTEKRSAVACSTTTVQPSALSSSTLLAWAPWVNKAGTTGMVAPFLSLAGKSAKW